MNKIWKPIPVHITLIEILSKKGALDDNELYKEVKKKVNDLSFRELNNILLKLEIGGFIRVSRLMKGKRRIEIEDVKQGELR